MTMRIGWRYQYELPPDEFFRAYRRKGFRLVPAGSICLMVFRDFGLVREWIGTYSRYNDFVGVFHTNEGR